MLLYFHLILLSFCTYNFATERFARSLLLWPISGMQLYLWWRWLGKLISLNTIGCTYPRLFRTNSLYNERCKGALPSRIHFDFKWYLTARKYYYTFVIGTYVERHGNILSYLSIGNVFVQHNIVPMLI